MTELSLPEPRPTARATLTAGYLDEMARHGATSADVLAVMPPTGIKKVKPYLSRPLFIGHAESEQLNSDMQHVRTALAKLPAGLYDGDIAAFATDAGMTGSQVSAVLRSRAGPGTGELTQFARGDLYPQPSSLRLLEFNMGSAIAGIDNADLCRALLRYPLLREFARKHRLGYPDTMGAVINLIFEETGFARDSYPVVAIVAWHNLYAVASRTLHKIARRWRTKGLDAHACHAGHLKFSNGRVLLRGRPVDIIFRVFIIEQMLEPDGPALINPIMDAVARGEVAMFTPFDSELFGSKAPLAMISDMRNRHLFSPAELAAIDRVLPWTRMVRPGPVTLEDGSTVDLFGYAISHAAELALKPTLLHGGIGVLPGWHPDTTEQVWRDELSKAMGGPYVLQRRVVPEPELCLDENGELIPWIVNWGIFSFPADYGGVYARAFPVSSGQEVTRAGTGLLLGSCLIAGSAGQ